MVKRSYQQSCALAQACDVIGERWSLLLIRDLLVGPRRFRELMHSLKGMGTNLLAARLMELQVEGIIERQTPDSGVNTYALTDRGRALEPVLLALVRWAITNRPRHEHGSHHMDEWDLVALKALFQPDQAKDLSVRVQFKTEQFSAWMAVDKQLVTMELGEDNYSDVIVNGTIKDLFADPKSLNALSFSGSKKKLKQYVAVFNLPA